MRTTRWTLLDEVLPEVDYRSRHERHVHAAPEEAAAAIERYVLGRDSSLPVRLLVRLRGLSIPKGPIRDVLKRSGFTVLAERPGQEVVAGTTGRFWALRERANMAAPLDLEDFQAFDRPGWAKAAFSLRIEPGEPGSSILVTETRVLCMDERARRRFTPYWAFIRVFSGFIRRDLLGGIARIAERGS